IRRGNTSAVSPPPRVLATGRVQNRNPVAIPPVALAIEQLRQVRARSHVLRLAAAHVEASAAEAHEPCGTALDAQDLAFAQRAGGRVVRLEELEQALFARLAAVPDERAAVLHVVRAVGEVRVDLEGYDAEPCRSSRRDDLHVVGGADRRTREV